MKKYGRRGMFGSSEGHGSSGHHPGVHHDDSSEYKDAYSNLSKSALVQESNIFNDKNLKEKKCIDLLNKVIFLLNQGEVFAENEKSQLFFNVTKLFQIPQSQRNKLYQNLRRLVYVLIKELNVNENEVFIVISCLTKDVQVTENDVFKANALRVLTKIIDEQYVQNIEKFLRQALIDKSNHVVSTAVVAHMDLHKKKGHSAEVAKKSVNELQDKLFNSNDGFIQYQALLILFEMKKKDNMASLKLLYQLTQKKLHSAIVKCQVMRLIKKSLFENTAIDQKTARLFLSFIESKLNKEEESVQFEAAKTLCELYEVYGSVIDVEPPFQVLTMLASQSSKPVNKYAALRVMNRIASQQPKLVGICQTELESLITDMNRSVASLAISTLLKTCNEDSVQKLLKQIANYLPDLGIDFKIEIIQSTKLLYQRIPTKASILLKFLADCLKEDGNVKFREAVVETIMLICPSQRDNALMILAEHIEDCEHPHIQTTIINFLALEGPKAANPSVYIRFIYNRINLERAVIRAAAVSALAAFANGVPSLKKSVLHLLRKCLEDTDDEVRERAYFFIILIEQDMKESVLEAELSLSAGAEDEVASAEDVQELADLRRFVFDQRQNIDVNALEAYLTENKEKIVEQEEELFSVDIKSMITTATISEQQQVEENQINSGPAGAEQQVAAEPGKPGQLVAGTALGSAGGNVDSSYLQEMKNEEALQGLIAAQRHIYSSAVQELTEGDAEYVIVAVKHFFETVVILQYQIQNTIEDQILSKVQIKLNNLESEHGLKVKGTVPLNEEDQIKYNEKRFAYIILSNEACPTPYPHVKIAQKLVMQVTEIDVETQDELGEYEEEFTQIQDLVIATKEYLKAADLPTGRFQEEWDLLGAEGQRAGTLAEQVQTFQLPFKSMNLAVSGVINFFGSMSVCEGTSKVNVTEKVHLLLLSGEFNGRFKVLVRGQIGFNQEYGCVIKLTVRSLDALVTQNLMECIN